MQEFFFARIKVVNFIGFFIEMTRNVTLTHCHFIKMPDQFFVLNRFGGRSVFCQMYQLKLINRQIWESLDTSTCCKKYNQNRLETAQGTENLWSLNGSVPLGFF